MKKTKIKKYKKNVTITAEVENALINYSLARQRKRIGKFSGISFYCKF